MCPCRMELTPQDRIRVLVYLDIDLKLDVDSHPKSHPSRLQKADSTSARVNAGPGAEYCDQLPRGDCQVLLAHYLVIQPLCTSAIVDGTLQLPWRSLWEVDHHHSASNSCFLARRVRFELGSCLSYSVQTGNPLFEPEPMENNNKILKELVTPYVLYQLWCIQPTQTLEGVPRDLLYDNTIGDTGGLHKDEGLLMMDRNMIDVESRGALMDKTLAAARHLISNMASNTQQFGARGGADTSKIGKPVDGAHIFSEVACCQPASTSCVTRVRDRKCIMRWSIRRRVIQLANRSVVQPLGVLEDVLVQVNELIFPANFYVLDIEDEPSREGSALILGRPFLMMARTKIDVPDGTLSIEFADTFVKINEVPGKSHYAKFPIAGTTKPGVIGVATLINTKFNFGIKCRKANRVESNSKRERKVEIDSNMQESTKTNSDNPEEVETVSNGQLETGFDSNKKESQQAEAESDWTSEFAFGQNSQWVSPIQVVSKKFRMTLIKNWQDEMVPARIQNSWRVCINYRKLNQATCKDHFPPHTLKRKLSKESPRRDPSL
ncbi:hypothetical protein CR513_17947, partial [Mucuna pruriens]